MTLSVIIVSYNVKYYVEQCLLSLFRATEGIECEVFVVDNHSRDESVEFLQERFPSVNFVASNHNLGFARANNFAIRQSTGRYVLLLNPDTIVAEDSISSVIGFMDSHPKAGCAGVRMLKTDGSDAMESRRGMPTPMTAFYKMSGLCSRFPKSRRFAHYYMSYLPWDEASKIEIVSGAFCMLRREAIDKVGLLDEDFFMYGEDIDLSYRILKGGFENWYVPTRILHYKGESTQKSSFRYVHVFYDAMFIFFRKHYGHLSVLLSIPVKAAIYLKATAALLKMLARKARRSVGFSDREDRVALPYVFLGSQESLVQCRHIARKKGLEAAFHVATAADRPDGHLSIELPKSDRCIVVYDTQAYTYSQIFALFGKSPKPGVTLGTYTPATKTIITGEEVLR